MSVRDLIEQIERWKEADHVCTEYNHHIVELFEINRQIRDDAAREIASAIKRIMYEDAI